MTSIKNILALGTLLAAINIHAADFALPVTMQLSNNPVALGTSSVVNAVIPEYLSAFPDQNAEMQQSADQWGIGAAVPTNIAGWQPVNQRAADEIDSLNFGLGNFGVRATVLLPDGSRGYSPAFNIGVQTSCSGTFSLRPVSVEGIGRSVPNSRSTWKIVYRLTACQNMGPISVSLGKTGVAPSGTNPVNQITWLRPVPRPLNAGSHLDIPVQVTATIPLMAPSTMVNIAPSLTINVGPSLRIPSRVFSVFEPVAVEIYPEIRAE